MTRALSLILSAALVLGFATGGQSQQTDAPPIPAKRLIAERDMDFYGADLRSIFDTTYEACKNACLNDTQCAAFTFNTRSNSCFPKSEVTQREPYEGAWSAQVVVVPPSVVETARQRARDIGFLGSNDLAGALKEAEAMPGRHLPGNWTEADLIAGAADARRQNRHADALRWNGPAIVLTDRYDLWLDYARDSLVAKASDSGQTRNLQSRALPAAINAYLRAPFAPAQADALEVMADALEKRNRGQTMIRALRLAEQLAPSARLTARLNDAIGKYGFRITEHRVDSDSTAPRICATFSEPLDKTVDYTPYVQLPGRSFSVEAQDSQLCIDGVEHGQRYQVTFRAGLPSASGEGMIKDTALALYVRDRSPAVRFPGRAYVLPKTPDAAVPIVTTNLSEVELTLSRMSDRNLIRLIQQDFFGRPIAAYDEEYFNDDLAEQVWSGQGVVETTLNQDVTTRLPMAEAISGLPAGVYALQAKIKGADPYDSPPATQWFVISDIGLATMSGADGLHIFTRSLASADAKAGLEVTLLSRSNRVLGTATTDADGYAKFAPGLTLGRDGSAPALVTAAEGEADIAFLSLTDPEFDLSDRGVEGREPAGPVDLFLATDRGAYRAGEIIHATALARDGRAAAIDGLPLTAILTRPDGVEYSRHFSSDPVAGGHVFLMPVGGGAPRGTWRLALHTDPKAPPVVSRTLLVEDFLPERIDFDLTLPDGPISAFGDQALAVEARYLFGAIGADLPVEGDVTLRAATEIDGFPGYRFGRHDEPFQPWRQGLDAATTDAAGRAELRFNAGAGTLPPRPMEAAFTVRVSEGSGRPVERRITRALAADTAMIGIKPLIDGVAAEGSEAAFELIGLNANRRPEPMRVKWTMNRVETRYQWYSSYGNWEWEPITRRTRIATGEVSTGVVPVQVAARVDWGNYELVVERLDGPQADQPVASSTDFWAGWYAPADASATPDILEVSLDKEAYRPGENAKLRMVPRYAGKALITVVSNRLIDMKVVEAAAGETLVDLPVTDEWGAGAYVTASLVRPMDIAAGHNPARALGLAHAAVDPGPAKLAATFEVPAQVAPRGPLDVALKVDGVAPGETAFATIAAVDQGILNLTGHQPPDASGHFFGQRKLGMGMRDVYGRLIDASNGAMGQVRSGGDSSPQMRMQAPPPTEELVAYFSGPVTVGADGYARTTFDMPSFNGTVKLMAVVWSPTGVGEASADVLVRDPVVVTASLPRFMAPGDQSRLLLELVHAEGPSGLVGLSVVGDGLIIEDGAVPASINLAEGGKQALSIPVIAGTPGIKGLSVGLVLPNGKLLEKRLTVPVELNDPEVARTSRFQLAAGDTFTLSRDVFAGLQPGSGTATLALGPLGRFDTPGLLTALDRYPYGCTEQVTSTAMPLLYFEEVARAMGMEAEGTAATRVAQAIDRVLSRQNSGGGFGLWTPYDGDFWLDAYVTDFLSRARARGHTVPDLAFSRALDNLRNHVNYAPDFEADVNNGGQDIAYALMVLAREGAAAMGDLRYYADVKGGDFGTPLASAQLGTALAMYGDQRRADGMFNRAAAMMAGRLVDEPNQVWRADYGTNLRDAAAVLTLAAESGTQVIDRETLTARVTGSNRNRSTQEAVWSLLAAHALIEATPLRGFTIDGAPIEGPLVQVYEASTEPVPVEIANGTGAEATLTLTTFGVPAEREPAGGNGYAIRREYYSMEGAPVDAASVAQGTRLVTVLTVTPFSKGEGRLMVNDPLPAGFEIDNPNLLRGGDIRALDWLKPVNTRNAEFRQERFLAAVDWRSDKPFQLAYIVRAVSPGSFHHPAALVEDMYRPQYRARTAAGRVTVTQ